MPSNCASARRDKILPNIVLSVNEYLLATYLNDFASITLHFVVFINQSSFKLDKVGRHVPVLLFISFISLQLCYVVSAP